MVQGRDRILGSRARSRRLPFITYSGEQLGQSADLFDLIPQRGFSLLRFPWSFHRPDSGFHTCWHFSHGLTGQRIPHRIRNARPIGQCPLHERLYFLQLRLQLFTFLLGLRFRQFLLD